MIRNVVEKALRNLPRLLATSIVSRMLREYRHKTRVDDRDMGEFKKQLLSVLDKVGLRGMHFVPSGSETSFMYELPSCFGPLYCRMSYTRMDRLTHDPVEIMTVLHSRATWVLICRSGSALTAHIDRLVGSSGGISEIEGTVMDKLRHTHCCYALVPRLRRAGDAWRSGVLASTSTRVYQELSDQLYPMWGRF